MGDLFKKFTSCLEISVGGIILLGVLVVFVVPSLRYIVNTKKDYSFLFTHEWGKPDLSISTIDVVKNAPFGPMEILNERAGEGYVIDWAIKIKEHALTHPEDKKYCVELLGSALEKVNDRFTHSNSGFLNHPFHPEKDALARSMIIKTLGEIGDSSAIPYLMKEVASPKETIVESACPQNLLEQNCKRSSFDNAVKALLKLGKKLDELPINWKEQFSKKPEEAIAVIYDSFTGYNAEELENVRIDNEKIINGAVDALKTCTGCQFLVAPFLTHASNSQSFIPVIEDVLSNSMLFDKKKVVGFDKGMESKKAILNKSKEAIKENKTVCYSEELYTLSRCYLGDISGLSCSGWGYTGKDKRSEDELIEVVKSDLGGSCMILSMDNGFLKQKRK